MMYRSITIQAGHVPRTRGATGTKDEQKFTATLAAILATKLRIAGWRVEVVGADPPGRTYPDTDLFLALHADGSENPDLGGASFFYPPRDEVESTAWGVHWAARHQSIAGYGFGFRRPNYVASVSTGFYAWRASRVASGEATPAAVALLCEHFFATNPAEYGWAWDDDRIDLMADAHVAALAAFNGGHPGIKPTIGDNGMIYRHQVGLGALDWLEHGATISAITVGTADGFVADGAVRVACSKAQIESLRARWKRHGILDETTAGDDWTTFAAAAGLAVPGKDWTVTVVEIESEVVDTPQPPTAAEIAKAVNDDAAARMIR